MDQTEHTKIITLIEEIIWMKSILKIEILKSNKNKNKIKRSRGPDGKIGEINNNRSVP